MVTFWKILLVLTAAGGGGALATAAHIPLGWLIGALLVSTGFTLAGMTIRIDRIRAYGLVVLGLSLGQSFTPEIMAQLIAYLPLILACGLFTLLSGLLFTGLFTKGAELDASTAFFCTIPGGVVLMAVQAQRAGASEAHLVLAQTVRLGVVVLSYPVLLHVFLPDHTRDAVAAAVGGTQAYTPADLLWVALLLAGGVGVAHLARRSFLPNPWMIAPCLFAIALQQTDLDPVTLPHWIVTVCQIILGVSLGARMVPDFLRRSLRLVVVSAVSTLCLTVLLVLAALAMARISTMDEAALLFGMSPGGMPEMTVAARAMGVSVPLVLSFHLTRILLANLMLEPFWHILSRLLARCGAKP
ncbi:AbrB family transcriptional regulator [Thioclava sp. GXIMD2076]|uniref:AbrB family transcriptional regulator n=1 Tax=Thioclava sp. GXIMD2076 TaxID=3131931 RepID=UPI0030D4FF6B